MTEPTQFHFIAWTHERDHINGQATCTAPEGADCRVTCTHGCEAWTIERNPDGKPYHRTGHLDDDLNEIRHAMEAVGYCNVVEFLNADASLLSELHTGADHFVIATIPITEIWEGDYYSWKRADA